jgi:hypothetical protein
MINQAERMQDFLETPFQSDDEERIILRLEHLAILNAKSGKFQAECQRERDKTILEATKSVLSDQSFVGTATSITKQYIDAKAHEWTYLLKWFERITSSSVHQIDTLRSILSYRKQQQTIL